MLAPNALPSWRRFLLKRAVREPLRMSLRTWHCLHHDVLLPFLTVMNEAVCSSPTGQALMTMLEKSDHTSLSPIRVLGNTQELFQAPRQDNTLSIASTVQHWEHIADLAEPARRRTL